MNRERTEAQTEASRNNGKLSHGPTTEEGKANSSRNNTRHGLLSNTILITGESAEQFDRLMSSLIREFEPQTESELLTVEEMVVTKWRQIRAWSMIAGAHTQAIDEQPAKSPETAAGALPARAFTAVRELNREGGSMDTLHRYDARFSRTCDRLLKVLVALKAKREKKGL
jgi:hypothetical protein